MLKNPQIFQHCKFKIILPLLMRKAHAARIPNPPAPGGAIYVTFQITWTISNGKKK